MRLTFRGPVLLSGGGCELGRLLAAALRAEGAQTCSDCRSEEGRAACEAEGLVTLPPDSDMTPERLPERCRAVCGAYPAHFVDLRHSRREVLLAGAAPEELDRWAAEDMADRARTLRAVTRAMLGGRFGRCVFVSSAATERPAPGQTLYSAAKAAGEALFRGTGIELAGKGITTCAARLPWLPLGRGRIFLETHETDAQRAMPAGKLVDTDAVVQALCWLISAEAAVINAAVIPLDGGLSSRKAGV